MVNVYLKENPHFLSQVITSDILFKEPRYFSFILELL